MHASPFYFSAGTERNRYFTFYRQIRIIGEQAPRLPSFPGRFITPPPAHVSIPESFYGKRANSHYISVWQLNMAVERYVDSGLEGETDEDNMCLLRS
jgi:hypothetical protein